MSGGLRNLLQNVIVGLWSLGVVLLALEWFLRLLGFYPSPVAPDRTLGYRWRPDAHYRWAGEGGSRGITNSAGWRDSEHALAKPPHTTRILICGDSYVEGLQVPLDSMFTRRLERALNARAPAGQRYEVIALGLSGAGTTQEYLMYRDFGARYQPDVVAVLFILNDWADNWFDPSQQRPYFVVRGDSLALDTSFVASSEFAHTVRSAPWKRMSSLVTLLAKVRADLRTRLHPTQQEAGLVSEQGWYYRWNFHDPPPPDSIPQFGMTARILRYFADQVHRDGRRFVLIAAGAAEQEERELLAAESKDPTFDPDKTQRWLTALGARSGFEVVPLTPAFRAASAAGAPPLWYGSNGRFGHWNAAGHALAARVLADHFAPR